MLEEINTYLYRLSHLIHQQMSSENKAREPCTTSAPGEMRRLPARGPKLPPEVSLRSAEEPPLSEPGSSGT